MLVQVLVMNSKASNKHVCFLIDLCIVLSLWAVMCDVGSLFWDHESQSNGVALWITLYMW